ncbi:endo-1,4-beta-xylanase-like [Melia azedarach]|uniref:Endo-1,4-beta-xylanase-like n=1 Tax=Melia azedarach TaxID=155640 RepID=A0ACC1XYC3_MELAZ|nr:endo-1,4-beta-xylanase-like [Melia azedarach]
MLKGGLTADALGIAGLYFESKNTSVEIWVDSISLQPFNQEEWNSHQQQSIEKVRKSNVRIRAVDKQGNPLRNSKISIGQKRVNFPFGCAINKNIINKTASQNWFTPRFGVTTFEDEMKCKTTLQSRGHNIFWDDPQRQPSWVKSLSPADLSKADDKRINSVMSRYKGQVIAWDVVNENLHFSSFESELGQNASGAFFNTAQRLDGAATLFMNEFNTIEESGDAASSPAKYLEKMREINEFPVKNNIKLGIGLAAHFGKPNIPYMRSSIDTLAATGSPIWLTEVDVKSDPNQGTRSMLFCTTTPQQQRQGKFSG